MDYGSSSKSVIITAGGSGSRFESDLPKQFLNLAGLPILMRTIRAFVSAIPGIHLVLVLPAQYIDLWKDLCDKYEFISNHQIAAGGNSRFTSVKNGLEMLNEPAGLVAVHDGVRPLVSTALIERVFAEAEQAGNAVPAIGLTDSLRRINGAQNALVNRDEFRIVQTPQCFRLPVIRKAFDQEYSPAFTDEASVVESIGESIHLIPGESTNIKVTTPEDLLIAETLFRTR